MLLGSKENIFEAICDVSTNVEDHLSFTRGNKIEVLQQQETSWYGHNLVTRKKGFFSKKNVEPYDDLKECLWYFNGMKRICAEQLLLRLGVPGTFMIRLSETQCNNYALSLRDDDSIKHYRIRLDKVNKYFIRDKCNFDNLKVLVKHYQNSADGLARKLENACPHPSPDSDSPNQNQWETNRNRIKLGKKLGEGYFSDVHEGLWNETIKVAVKKMKSDDMQREEFLAEATVMKCLSHPKLVRLYAICSLEPIYIILELMSKGNLSKFLQSKEGKKLLFPDLICISAQIADGMSFLELHNLVHRDLAARNILVGENNTVKVADFGSSKRLDKNVQSFVEENKDFKFAIKWASPEVKKEKRFSIKSDIWSFGIVMYEIATKGYIPENENIEVTNEFRDKFSENMIRWNIKSEEKKSFDEFYKLMLNCWYMDPESRPSFKSLKEQFNCELIPS